jgi:hypothetical protein
MNSKLILEILDGIVIWAEKVDLDKWKDNMLPYFPYRKPTLYFGNPYARALRARDYRRGRGRSAEVFLVDGTDIKKYLLKRYLGEGNGFVNDEETEEERLHRVNMSLVLTAFCPKNRIATPDECDIDFSELELIDEIDRNKVAEKFYLREPFTEVEDEIIRKNIDKIKGITRLKIFFIFGKLYATICLAPKVGTNEIPTIEHIRKYKDIAMKWWNNLIGTEGEDLALCQMARLCIASQEESRGIEFYEKVLQRKNIDSEDALEIQERIKYVGSGREIIDEAEREFKDGNYSEVCKLMEDFDKKSTGFTRQQCMGRYRMLYGVSSYRLKENSGEKNSTDKYKDLVYNSKSYISKVDGFEMVIDEAKSKKALAYIYPNTGE